jgi:hypothetical protein
MSDKTIFSRSSSSISDLAFSSLWEKNSALEAGCFSLIFLVLKE